MKRLVLLCLAWLLGLELASLLGYFVPILEAPLWLLAVALTGWTAWRSVPAGLGLLAAEYMIASHGHMLALGPVSLRLGMFGVFMAVWLVRWVARGEVQWPRWQDAVWQRYGLLVLAIGLGLVFGVVFGNGLGAAFDDGNGYGAFVLLFPLLMQKEWPALEKIQAWLGAAVGWLAFKTLFILYFYTHFSVPLMRLFYVWLRDTRVAEITYQFDNFYRVFLQSQIYLIPALLLGYFALVWREAAQAWRWQRALFLSLLAAAFALSLSRSFHIGFVVAGGVMLLLSWKRITWKTLLQYVASTVVGVGLLLLLTVNFPLPFRGATDIDFGDVFGKRYGDANDAAIGSRWQLLWPMVGAIQEKPMTGWGFGKSLTYTSQDPRIIAMFPDGKYTTMAFEWGFLDIWLKMGFLGVVAYAWILLSLLWRGWQQRFSFAGTFVVATILMFVFINTFTPYHNYPLGIAILLACELVLFRQKQLTETVKIA